MKTMVKKKLLVVTGRENDLRRVRKEFDVIRVDTSGEDINSAIAPDAIAIVVITRYRSRHLPKAKRFAKKRGIPCIPAYTGNAILPEMEKDGLYSPPVVKVEKEVDTSDAPVEEKPESHTAFDSLSHDDLWKEYRDHTIETIRSIFKAGEVIGEDLLLSELSEELGVPVENLEEFPSELQSKGIIFREHDGGPYTLCRTEYDFHEETKVIEEKGIKKPEKKPDFRALVEEEKPLKRKNYKKGKDIPRLLKGLPEGPYRTTTEIADELMCYSEFRKKDGETGVRGRYVGIVGEGRDAGVIQIRDYGNDVEMYYVTHDPEVALTRVEGSPLYSYPRSDIKEKRQYTGVVRKVYHEKRTIPSKSQEEMAKYVGGLSSGPYATKSDLQKEMIKYVQFLRDDGTTGGFNRYFHIVRKAVSKGIVVERKEGFFVVRDLDINLTYRDGEGNDFERVVTSVGLIGKINALPYPTDDGANKLFNLVKPEYRRECAVKALESFSFLKTALKTIVNCDIANLRNDTFTEVQWKKLMWFTLKRLPLSVVITALKK